MKSTVAAKDSIIERSEKTIIKLSNISSIKAGEYWCTYTASPQKPGVLTSAVRTYWYANEDRNLNRADIDETVSNAFRILRDIEDVKQDPTLDDADLKIYEKIITELKSSLLNARDGISHLKVTYHDDVTSTKQLDKTIETITIGYKKQEGVDDI